jgi:hypothetical protein
MAKKTAVLVVLGWLLVHVTVDAQQTQRGWGRGPLGRRGLPGDVVFLLLLDEVQQELRLTSQQQELLQAVLADLEDQRRGIFQGGPGRGDRDNASEEIRAAMQKLSDQGEKLVMSVLEPDQAYRLRQLRLQWSGVRALARPEIARQLKLSEAQQTSISSLLQSDSDRQGRTRPDDQSSREDMTAQIMALLTDQQKQTWQSIQGDPFDFPDWSRRFGPRGPRGRGGRRP